MMPVWLTPVISLLAFIVSACSLFISWRTQRRSIEREQVTGWIELTACADKEYFRAKLHLKNPSPLDIRLERLAVDLPDYRLVDIQSARTTDQYGATVEPEKIRPKELCIAMSVSLKVASGSESEFEFLLHQPAHSQRRSTQIKVMFWVLGPKPKWNILPIKVTTRSPL